MKTRGRELLESRVDVIVFCAFEGFWLMFRRVGEMGSGLAKAEEYHK